MLRPCSFVLFLMASLFCHAQPQGRPDVAAQREAMKKLAFLVGTWSGEGSILRGSGASLKIRQTEQVQYKLDGLVLVIEGTGRDPDSGKVNFNALAIVAYDEETRTYRFRSYNDGRYLDSEMKVSDEGFEWGYQAGPASMRFVMKLNDKSEWVETGDLTIGGQAPRRTIDLLVRRQR